MSDGKNTNTTSLHKNALNDSNKTIINTEFNSMKQDLLFFKNDILKDVRKMEEKIHIKLTEQNIINSEQYNAYEKKLDMLSAQINHINSNMLDNSNLFEKLNILQAFKTRAEDRIFTLSSNMYTFQREYKDNFTNIEKLINDNLKYPGVIGKNSKFLNFRRFIDYILNYFKEFNEFKDEIRNLDFNNFKRKINSNLQELRFSISDSYRHSLNLIENNMKQFDSKLEEIINKNKKVLEENEKKFGELKNKIVEYLSENQTKFTNMEKNINNKYSEQLNEIENLKNKFVNDMNNFESSLKSIKEINEQKIENNEQKNIQKINDKSNNNYIPEGESRQILKENDNNIIINDNNNNDKNYEKIVLDKSKEIQSPQSLRNINNQVYITSKGRNNFILKEILLNNNNNDKIDSSPEKNINMKINIQDSEEKNYTNLDNVINKRMNQTQTIVQSKSFEKLFDAIRLKNRNHIDENNELKNSKERLALTQDEIMIKKERMDIIDSYTKKPEEKNIYNKYINFKSKDLPKNNYSITNIANIKIKKLVLPEFLTKRSTKLKMNNSSLSENKRNQNIANNKSSSAKYIFRDEKTKKKSLFDIAKINKHKSEKIKGMKFPESSKTIDKKIEPKIKENLNSLKIMKIKQRNNAFHSIDNINKGKTRNWSFDKNKNEKDENTQIGFRKTFYEKNKFKEIILLNTKQLKKNRKIKL